MSELTLTGGTTLRNNATIRPGSSLSQSHHHSHDHSHGDGGHVCAQPALKLDASTLLPSKEQVDLFKTNKNFRLGILSNVVRGGTYSLFVDLLTVLISSGEGERRHDTEGSLPLSPSSFHAAIKDTDHVSLAQMLDGYGADGHTLAHWCAKRGRQRLRFNFFHKIMYSLLIISHFSYALTSR